MTAREMGRGALRFLRWLVRPRTLLALLILYLVVALFAGCATLAHLPF